jgi:TetR/AcrR family transcriptional regulator, transcriptional repressor for nem operon
MRMTRTHGSNPRRGDARTRLLEAARDLIRAQGYADTTVDDLCTAAGVTKGAFFHHFDGKEALGVAAAQFWSETTARFFEAAPYHAPTDPLARVLSYIDFRRAIIAGEPAEFTCLAGTMAQETFATSPAIRDACGAAIFDHANTLVADIEAARRGHRIAGNWDAASLARHTQAVLQGAFVLAKACRSAGAGRAIAVEQIDHLKRYVELLFSVKEPH